MKTIEDFREFMAFDDAATNGGSGGLLGWSEPIPTAPAYPDPKTFEEWAVATLCELNVAMPTHDELIDIGMPVIEGCRLLDTTDDIFGENAPFTVYGLCDSNGNSPTIPSIVDTDLYSGRVVPIINGKVPVRYVTVGKAFDWTTLAGISGFIACKLGKDAPDIEIIIVDPSAKEIADSYTVYAKGIKAIPDLNPKTLYEYTLSQIVNKTHDEFSWPMPQHEEVPALDPKTPIEYYLSFLVNADDSGGGWR